MALGWSQAELSERAGISLAIPRSSQPSLDLLAQGLVHVAGLHLSSQGDDCNATAVRSKLGEGYKLLPVATWQEGLAISRGQRVSSIRSAVKSRLRWVGRADAGVCLRLTCEESGLNFLSLRNEQFELCYSRHAESDPRIQALVRAVRSEEYRRLLMDLPGYDPATLGDIRCVT